MMLTQALNDPTPAREDDEPWPHVLLTENQAFYADEAGELVDIYLPGYHEGEDHDAALAERSIDLAGTIQQEIFNSVIRTRPDVLGDEAILTLLMEDKHVVIPTRGGEVFHYDDKTLPLIVANAAYVRDDGSVAPMPEGEGVAIVDGSGEKEFLLSLESLGLHRYMVAPAV